MTMTANNDSETTRIEMSSPTSVAIVAPRASKVEPFDLSKQESQDQEQCCWSTLKPSAKSLRTHNPIRAIVDPIAATIQSGEDRGDGKDLISLALGDPTAFGNLPPCPAAVNAVLEAVRGPGHAAGYVNACGTLEARTAVAAYHSASTTTTTTGNTATTGTFHVTADNVIMANGCSGALELAFTALLDPGSILLVPKPGFPLYQVIAESHGATVVHYRLLPDQQWECDLEHLEELLLEYGDRVRGILVNNPGNPAGSVFGKRHLQELVRFCDGHRLPIVADEIYGDLTFGSNVFYPLAQVAAEAGGHVPVITASGVGKQYLIPGWRVGWIVFQDNVYGSLREVEAGAKRLAQVILGASHLAQTCVPALLNPTDASIQQWKLKLRQTLEHQATFLCQELADCHGLDVMIPGGAMYALVHIDPTQMDEAIENDVDFSKLLLQEENVFVLPGVCFGVRDVFRVVYCAPVEILQQAAERIHQFCERHSSGI